MTDKEKAIVMAYTGIAMLTGNKFQIFHKYVEEIMCRPVFTHEFATCAEEIKEKAKFDFLALCVEEERERPHGEWKDLSDGWQEGTYECSNCKTEFVLIEGTPKDNEYHFCPNCGASMKGGDPE